MSTTAGPSMDRDRVRIFDGGMGSTLRDEGLKVQNPLWGTDLIISDPNGVRKVHQGFLEAGSDLIGTNTYQLSIEGVQSHFGPSVDLDKTFAKGIQIAHDAIECQKSSTRLPSHTGIVLSLGSFGSTLGSAQEYTGVYPPPYGLTSRDDDDANEECISALQRWHFERLTTYAKTSEWSSVEWLAFETVPLINEIIAIRRAMAQLAANGTARKKFWIVSAFTDGLFPLPIPDQPRPTPRDIVLAACGPESRGGSPADGVGINCTHPQYISGLCRDFTQALVDLAGEGKVKEGETAMVLYPDGGKVIDENNQLKKEDMPHQIWAESLANPIKTLKEARDGLGRDVWKQVIVGGCCESSFAHIKELRAVVDSLN
ncbi:Homocysteine S-methyltransferase [Kockovaella imperatae]|uniref:Homocysteine S-methyltransferase n=1 Tax=Kockovaella imperatae TaxID=4999 RepID=A0A1Y1U946_9TREE|nr:Homocysteine S-methyltransferase [Kockovaella imperatae]ORX34027.1 Homocysteine S-methyltransferase [Kockovaella imperatae]